ncbi:MAG: hypothetical protein H7224_09515 [Polaromonas sp.]|nr:hypothetical protein [Polaromonas sp.]
MSSLAAGLVAVAGSVLPLPAAAAPFTPTNDAEVVERLPGRASDPAVRRVESLRKQLAARPGDAALRIEVARRYFDMAMAQGDPRYMGYASSALAPLQKLAPNEPGYPLALGLIQQYSHNFEAALASLSKAAQLAPLSPEPLLWRTAIFMVQARYSDAAAECARLAPLTDPLTATGCSAYVQAATGQLQSAFQTLAAAVKAAPQAPAELLLWQNTRLAEMAWRLQRFEEAEMYFKTALKLGVTDQFLLGAYADFLLERQRPAEVISLLTDWERSDILLLRLALAGKAANDKRAALWATQLRDRFAAAALRGDRLHEQEAARFELVIEGNPAKALSLASHNYDVQKEPRDADILLRAALAAGQVQPAQPALDWLQSSHYEDPTLNAVAAQVRAMNASTKSTTPATAGPAR